MILTSAKEAKLQDGLTSLVAAADNGHVTIVEALLAAGADKEAKTQNGGTALMGVLKSADNQSNFC